MLNFNLNFTLYMNNIEANYFFCVSKLAIHDCVAVLLDPLVAWGGPSKFLFAISSNRIGASKDTVLSSATSNSSLIGLLRSAARFS